MAELKSSGLSAQEDIEALSPRDDSQVQYDIKGDSSDGGDAEGEAKPHPMQKRRRVTRACDECRRKKIKCDGKQPCTHCTVYSYECTYDQPSNRRRNPAPQYIEALEQRLQKAESVLRTVLPGVDIDDPKFDAHSAEQIVQTAKSKKAAPVSETRDDGHITPMVDRVGSLDLDDHGNYDFHGHSSGFAFMRKFRAQFGEQYLPYPPSISRRNIVQMLESPRSAQSSPFDTNASATMDLPPKGAAIELCRNAIDDCFALMRPLHRPTFFRRLHAIYDTDPDHYTTEHLKFLPLLYVVMGLGCLFAKSEDESSMLEMKGYKEAIEQGYQYFSAGKQMLDITDCRDLTTLQCIFVMIVFLQSSAKLATCYSYIGIALRACCRLGLHRDLPAHFKPVEAEERKRLFWLIRKMDTYVGAMLGLPQMLSEEDIDQQFPLEVDDKFISDEGIQSMPEDMFPLMKATNAHTVLTRILRKVVRYVYPIKGVSDQSSGDGYTISHDRIRELEQDLQEWMHELPLQLRPSDDASRELSRVQQLLRISYAHVQMMMYRPFIHYVSQTSQRGKADKRSYACAAACVSVARNIVHITSEMKRRGLLVGAYWFVMYTTYFAIVSLVYFVLENPHSSTGEDILQDALEGRDTLASLARRSLAADRCTASLASLFNELPEKLHERRVSMASPVTGKKRQAPSDTTNLSSNRSTPNINIPGRESTATPSRARTLPHDFLAKIAKRNSLPDAPIPVSFPYPGTSPQNQHLMNVNSPNVASPLSQQFEVGTPQLAPSQIPDLSNVMFPSDNPFAYPNQALATLESVDPGYSFSEMGSSFPGSTDQSMMGTPSSMGGQPQQAGYDIDMRRLYEENPQLAAQINASRQQYGGFQGQQEYGQQQQRHNQYGMQQQQRHQQSQHQDYQGRERQHDRQQSQSGLPQQQQQDYWTQMSKGNMGTRTGFTPGASVNLDELFGGESWGGGGNVGVWGGGMGLGMSQP